jgi:hypothetical protein
MSPDWRALVASANSCWSCESPELNRSGKSTVRRHPRADHRSM